MPGKRDPLEKVRDDLATQARRIRDPERGLGQLNELVASVRLSIESELGRRVAVPTAAQHDWTTRPTSTNEDIAIAGDN